MVGATRVKIFKCLMFSALLAINVSRGGAQDLLIGGAAHSVKDYKTAWKELLPLANQGDVTAQIYIGFMYENGEGVIQNYIEAFKWYQLAADQGSAVAQYNLGLMYVKGEGVVQSFVEAVKWFRISAYQGYDEAQAHLGANYEYGVVVIQNNVIAHMWYNIASANGAENSAKRRDEIAAKMTREEIAKAQAMAQQCIGSGYKNCGD